MTAAIQLINITKTFRVPTEKMDTLRERLLNFKLRTQTRKLKALSQINLEVKPGEWLGVVGPNGSGKSTLLKIIAGIYEPNNGEVEVNGRLVPFLELGVGFNPDLSALDNIWLNGVILGMSRKNIKAKMETIIKFAGIKSFINQKLKIFSTGMQVRLAFSIAIQSPGDIFLLDEVLAVGDYEFRQKSKKVFQQMKRQGKTVIIVSHELDQIIDYCDQVIWMDHGRIVKSGSPKLIIKQYIDSQSNK